jgi:hypothetical protein
VWFVGSLLYLPFSAQPVAWFGSADASSSVHKSLPSHAQVLAPSAEPVKASALVAALNMIESICRYGNMSTVENNLLVPPSQA